MRATSFCEYADTTAQDPDMVRAEQRSAVVRLRGIRTRWRGVRGSKSTAVEGEHELFGFFTTEANAIVAPVRPKAMPVILTTTGSSTSGWRARRSRR